MNISVKGEYALKAIFDLACQDVGQPVKIAAITRTKPMAEHSSTLAGRQ